ncbi:hypothetical protein [Litorimonas sp.]|uniref:hypothetical protein n=1 Tax=Litorimonas sp. TaxID=1892381 RepID=UPI003A8C4140
MKIEPRKPTTPFDFGQAAGAWFNTSGGKEYALRLWVWHSAAILVVLMICQPLMLPHYADILEASWRVNQQTMSGQPSEDVSIALWAAIGQIALPTLLFVVGLMVTTSMGESALYRKYLLGAEPARIPIRLDIHTGRNLLAQIGFYALYLVVYVLGLLAIILVAGFLGMMFAPMMAILPFFGVLFLMVLLIVYPIRFAPAAALTALDGKTHVLAARNVTKQRFWSLFGVYLVIYIGGYIGYYMVSLIGMLLVSGNPDFLTAMSGFGGENPRPIIEATIDRFSNPLYMILGIVAMTMMAAALSAWILWIAGVSAYAVRWWHSDDPAPAFE